MTTTELVIAPVKRDAMAGLIRDRSGGVCEVQTDACTTTATMTMWRDLCGSRTLTNLLHTCRNCHDWIMFRYEESVEFGWSLRPNPLAWAGYEPVYYRREWRLLSATGGTVPLFDDQVDELVAVAA